MNPLSLASGTPWMIRAEALRALMAGLASAPAPRLDFGDATGPKRKPAYAVRSGVALIPVSGPIYCHSSLLDDWLAGIFGGVSLDSLAASLASALAAPEVRSVLFVFDSPGGEAKGLADFAGTIRAACGVKPVAAFAEGDCCSAAYYLASATGEITASRSAIVGCIGTVIPYVDATKMMESIGLEDVTIVSSQSPDKWPDPATPDGRPPYQRLVDSLAEIFVLDVAKYRGVTRDKVLADFGRGWVLVGDEARKAGLADRVGTLDSVVAKLAGPNRGRLAASGPDSLADRPPVRARLVLR